MDKFTLRHHESLAMLDRYVGECMVSLININNGIIEPTHEYQKIVISTKYSYLVGTSR
jgi:hypothetical protein